MNALVLLGALVVFVVVAGAVIGATAVAWVIAAGAVVAAVVGIFLVAVALNLLRLYQPVEDATMNEIGGIGADAHAGHPDPELIEDAPRCDRCGAPVTTGFMAVFCPRADRCEFWPEDPETVALVRRMRGGGVVRELTDTRRVAS